MENDNDGLVSSILETQMLEQGVGSIRVKDGQVFMFSTEVLEQLLEKANGNPAKRVLFFIKTGPNVSQTIV